MSQPRRYSDMGLYRRLMEEARPFWPRIGLLLLLNLLAIPLTLLTPVPVKIAVDNVIGSEPLPTVLHALMPDLFLRTPESVLFVAVWMLLLIAVLEKLRDSASHLLSTYTGERLVLSFRSQLFRHAQRLSLAYHDTHGTSDASYRIQYDAPAIEWVAIYGVIPLLTSLVTLTGMVIVTARLDRQLALVALAVVPVLFLATQLYLDRMRQQSHAVKDLESAALGVLQEALGALRVVKAFGQEERERERFVRQSGRRMQARVRLSVTDAAFALVVATIMAAGSAAVLLIGVRHVQSGTLTLGELLLVMGYLTQLYVPLQTLSKTATSLQSAFASAERAFSLLDESPEVEEPLWPRRIATARGHVAFREVSFAYDGQRPVLRDISFEIGPGTRIGIVGATGTGKTTLMSLLTRFYDPTEGAILLDGVDIREYALADLRQQFAIVLQEPVLFSTTIAENIAYARPGVSYEQIVRAAKAANAHDFILSMPDGYQTIAGERGMRLSGGERQRISLARAFLRDSPMLILDEPTSSVDVETEAVIMEAMNRLMEGRTSFMIAHRLRTLARCDVLLTIEQGRLVMATYRPAADVHIA